MSGSTEITYTVRVAQTPEDIEQCMKIRKQVFVDEQYRDQRVGDLSDPPSGPSKKHGGAADLILFVNDGRDDARSTHFLMLRYHENVEDEDEQDEQGEPIGTLRLINDNNQLGRFALIKPYRGKGLGKPLIEFVHEYVSKKGGKEVWCQSQAADPASGGVDATGFYKKLGYVNRGELYMKEGTRHQDMVFTL
uniref:N-acetyltransferase domain-containing protein n=1 Tax=Kwoniella dejecticola CBS 10117 TaxID=1296121 RepID=A0A1A6ADS9_9TREE|nr:uncharacterized protein I303_00031 [Kwoniella dejecticola CBS 10117]OBR88220.1 hypothetical protein I303_00031 [Kwoniella dejecticola CBS 10117]